MYKYFILLILPSLLLSRLLITTHMPFEAFIINKITEGNVRIRTITNNYSPKTLDLKYSEVSKFANTKAYFHFGLDVEKKYQLMIQKINPNIIIFDMSTGIKKLKVNGKDNNYVWMDPILLRDISKNIYDFMILFDPLNKEYYKRNYEILLSELDESFLKIRKILYSSEIYNIYVFDKYWDYYASRFGINIYRKEKQVIKADEINKLVSHVDKNEIKAVLVSKDATYTYARSISGNTDISIKINDVFNEFVTSNIWELSKDLSK